MNVCLLQLDDSLRIEALKGPGMKIDPSKKLRVGIVGSGLAGMVTAMDLSDAGHEVEIFEARNFVGGKVGSWVDKDGNHIEMGLHVFFGCYYNLFGILERVGTFDRSMRLKEHTHIFVNKGGGLGALDFRMGGIGAPFNGLKAFATTEQLGLYDKIMNAVRPSLAHHSLAPQQSSRFTCLCHTDMATDISPPLPLQSHCSRMEQVRLGTSPIVRALVDFDGGMQVRAAYTRGPPPPLRPALPTADMGAVGK